jgi:hypothetical protein
MCVCVYAGVLLSLSLSVCVNATAFVCIYAGYCLCVCVGGAYARAYVCCVQVRAADRAGRRSVAFRGRR